MADTRWDKLDNTANLFPVIVSEQVSNVFRVSVTLKEDIEQDLLQKALDKVLPYFKVFKSVMKQGFFWYYFEENNKPAPKVKKENECPCAYINPYTNNGYQFRLSYYGKRINLDTFHVITDGNGALMFLKEVVYQYLRFKYPELAKKYGDSLSVNTSLDNEDSYIKNYRKSAKKTYKTTRALVIKGEMFNYDKFGMIHGYIDLQDIKKVSKGYGVTINQYLLGVLLWSVYKEYLKGEPSDRPIASCVPVNLRPYFGSNTTKNFFAIVTAVFKPERNDYTFEEVLDIVAGSLNEQINKENLEKLFSYNVSNEKNFLTRSFPLFIKKIAMKTVFKASAKANTMTVTNLGLCTVDEQYKEFIDKFYIALSLSKNQNLKGGVVTYNNTLVFTFSAAVKETAIQRCFFRKLVEEGIKVGVESNGVYYE